MTKFFNLPNGLHINLDYLEGFEWRNGLFCYLMHGYKLDRIADPDKELYKRFCNFLQIHTIDREEQGCEACNDTNTDILAVTVDGYAWLPKWANKFCPNCGRKLGGAE